MFSKTMIRGLLAVALVASAVTAAQSATDVFKMPTGLTSLQFVTAGDANNTANTQIMYDGTTGYGSIDHLYKIGKNDVTAAQYVVFLNSVAKTDTYGLYNTSMATDTSYGCGIVRAGTSGSYTYVTNKNGDFPVNYISWGVAARFSNWLQNGQPTTGVEGNDTTETGAYTMNNANTDEQLMAVTRNPGATYFIPTENEYYKAAYYKGGSANAGYWSYPMKSSDLSTLSNVLSPTGTNNANFYNGGYTDLNNYLTPVGYFTDSPGPYGTFDMGGDVWQWNETNTSGSERGLSGSPFSCDSNSLASSDRSSYYPMGEDCHIGFRVASSVAVPEPGSIALLLSCAVTFGIWRRRKSA